ncbi:MAG: MBL fold metallo-hydrolase [Candidatus Omnitrophica bacterium]|nr:MBL fold metallo-hydrolase [Candidatus Omnitrophota bacterium]
MKALEIKKDIFWVGGIDWDLRNFHGYLTQRGSTYNSYLIKDEKLVLVDTVKYYLFDEMLERIKKIADPSKIDYVVCNHVEMDHSGSLPRIMEICPEATVVTSPNGEKGLKFHYDTSGWDIKVVNTGDSLNIGKRDLSFVLTQMVHWPDSMATYVPRDRLLIPNDAFGQHIASEERFDDEIGWDIVRSEAAKYYANIVLPYGNQVQRALEAVAGLDVDMIAPSHGLIWRRNIDKILELYGKWSANESVDKAVIVYDTMWGSTGKIAYSLQEAFEEKGIVSRIENLRTCHISDIMTHVLDSRYICVGSPTLNNGMLPTVGSFLTYLKGLSPRNRKAMAFGSYGWGGQSIPGINEVLSSCGFEMMESLKVQYVPRKERLDEIKEKVKGELTERV